MTIDTDRFSQAIFLAVGDPPTADDADRLARQLSAPDEILPYLLLRRNGFEGCRQMAAALAAAVAGSPGRPITSRAPDLADAVEMAAARKAVTAATRTVIDHDLAGRDVQAGLDEAMLQLVRRSPASPGDAIFRIRR
jgi:hypothetical protein